MDEYKRRMERDLVAPINRAEETARELADPTGSQGDDESDDDEVVDAQFAEADVERRLLTQVREALARIENGTFGRCMIDGKAIPEKRLEVVPTA